MIKKSYSQAKQDFFAHSIVGDAGTYIEIGGNDPIICSNTYSLEVDCGWKGFSIELDHQHKSRWNDCLERNNQIFWDNALTFDYLQALKDNNMPTHLNYLSCDIEPPINTLNALKRVITAGITFDCITFEHDAYQNQTGIDFNYLATEFLAEYGYKVAVYDVFVRSKKTNNIFETWFVRNDLEFVPCSFIDWRNNRKDL